MNEGDVAVVFSQYGEIADLLLVPSTQQMRDKKTKKSRGFAFVCYVDQRSTDLAVDNLNGISLCGRTIKVDHVKDFKLPKEYTELKDWEQVEDKLYKPTGPDGKGWGVFRQLSEEEIRAIKQLEEYPRLTRQAERMKQVALSKREKFNSLNPASKIDQDELWEENLMRQMKAFETKGLDEAREKLKAIKKQLKKEKKKQKSKKASKEKSGKKAKNSRREQRVKQLKESSKEQPD